MVITGMSLDSIEQAIAYFIKMQQRHQNRLVVSYWPPCIIFKIYFMHFIKHTS